MVEYNIEVEFDNFEIRNKFIDEILSKFPTVEQKRGRIEEVNFTTLYFKNVDKDIYDYIHQQIKENPEKAGITHVASREVNKEDPEDIVNHPKHYERENAVECIDEMLLIFGRIPTAYFCLLNVWKYRYRSDDKNGSIDIQKSDWYMNKFIEIVNTFNNFEKHLFDELKRTSLMADATELNLEAGEYKKICYGECR